ncbi:MAG: hypothetical protein KKG09_10205 [Verrucomicrobia bacterium]|nr:hypothetical protein [Verrucomicrobiota bacterium]MBU4247944.1 hypothetical protein [Verrucomicrobiota bacterium]MBU4289676.1 hypothetical protein [Verrucomicrobiota bacterium]MBU4498364.1 hypothetical protein [Verrucomicrobiota bacterium]MCG2679192.1 hypothetical protein [Kiritimatiellia bacterium]
MPYPQLNRSRLLMKPLGQRRNRVLVNRDFVAVTQKPSLNARALDLVDECAAHIRAARRKRCPVIISFGAHTIKNGLAPVLIQLMDGGWLTHLATNGAGIIHDWEFAYQGASSEDVRENIARGEFGHWQETGFFINLALNLGACEGKGYGESVGAMIQREKLVVPSVTHLRRRAARLLRTKPDQAAARAELLAVLESFRIKPGILRIPHPWKSASVQATAFRLGIPFTGHPMIGHDIIYNHPMNNGALLGRAALRDFLTFAESVSRIQNGVYLSIGSAVMSPMIFEKAMAMAQNLARQRGRVINGHYIFVVDLAKAGWDWRRGAPPENNPAYYQRFNKSFSRMGGALRYLSADNRDFLLALCQRL